MRNELDVNEVKAKTGQVVVASKHEYSISFDIGDKKVKINGKNEWLRGQEGGILSVTGVGYTVVAEKDWNAIKEKFKNHAAIANNLIFAEKTKESATDKAKDLREIKTGLEPVDTKKTRTQEDKNK